MSLATPLGMGRRDDTGDNDDTTVYRLEEPEITMLSHPRLVPRPPREMPRGTEPQSTDFSDEPTTTTRGQPIRIHA